ncbi:MAG: DNA alkylation repair protein [Patescibacteria group bacterium]
MSYNEVIEKMEALANPKNVEGMARFGIRPKTKVLGIPIPELRKIAKSIRHSSALLRARAQDKQKIHALALALFDSKIHEARILAGYIADPQKITKKQFEKWVKTFDSWDVVDQVCSSCLDKTNFAYKKIFELSKRKEEFVKRAAFTLICCLTAHDKKMPDEKFLKFFPLIKNASTDERNFVKKAVNWALRGIGKRNKRLNKKAIKLALQLRSGRAKSQRWIGADAYRELTGEAVQKRLK